MRRAGRAGRALGGRHLPRPQRAPPCASLQGLPLRAPLTMDSQKLIPTVQSATERVLKTVATGRILLIALSHCDLDRTAHTES